MPVFFTLFHRFRSRSSEFRSLLSFRIVTVLHGFFQGHAQASAERFRNTLHGTKKNSCLPAFCYHFPRLNFLQSALFFIATTSVILPGFRHCPRAARSFPIFASHCRRHCTSLLFIRFVAPLPRQVISPPYSRRFHSYVIDIRFYHIARYADVAARFFCRRKRRSAAGSRLTAPEASPAC